MTEREWKECGDLWAMVQFVHHRLSEGQPWRFEGACDVLFQQVRLQAWKECWNRRLPSRGEWATIHDLHPRKGDFGSFTGRAWEAAWCVARRFLEQMETIAPEDFLDDRKPLHAVCRRIRVAARKEAGRAGERAVERMIEAVRELTSTLNGPAWEAARAAEQRLLADAATQRDLLRDIVGPYLFRIVALDPIRLMPTVQRLVEAIDNECAYDRLPILADALEEAGCVSHELLSHCRAARPHVRGCWVIHLLLGKEPVLGVPLALTAGNPCNPVADAVC